MTAIDADDDGARGGTGIAADSFYRALVHEGSDIVLIHDDDGHCLYVSPTIERILGWTPEYFAEHGREHVATDDLVAVEESAVKGLSEPGTPLRFELRIEHADGSWRWFELRAINMVDVAVVGGIMSNLRDITERKEAEEALRLSGERFRAIAASSPIGIYQLDAEPVLRFVNERWQEITGHTASAALGGNWQRILHDEDRAASAELWARTGALGRPFRSMLRLVRPDGDVRWVMAATEPLFDGDGSLTGHVGTLDDITERLATQRSTERLSDIVEATSDLVVITDRSRRVIYMNAAARAFYGLGPDDPIHDFDFTPFAPQWVQDKYLTETIAALKERGIWSGELGYLRHGVEVPVSALFLAHHDSDGHIEFVSSVTRDISENKAFERRLEYQATHDPLTGLPNRTLFLDRLELALIKATRSGKRVAVLFCDLDNFKVVNDSLGHGAGDRLLVAHAERLRVALRPGDTVARFGGDEFVILCDDLDGEADAIVIAERVLDSVLDPLAVEATEVFGAMSIGIALSAEGTDPETMIRDADAAMYRAKAKGRARFELFDERMRATVIERLDIESALRRALARHELRVVYQPAVDLRSGAIVGVEALLRWEHPERGPLAPADFIDVAEETGLIVAIGSWVIDQACRQAQRWQATRPAGRPLLVSVNISGRQLDSVALIDNIADVIARTGIDASLIGLEITESVIMRDPEASSTALQALKQVGVRIAVDDFGTGYSSLAYLRRFPVDLLKVDRAFVDGLGRDPEDSAIVAAVVSLAHTLGMQAIAEGVETAAQLDELRALGCDMAQGFLIARPLAADAIEDLLASDPRW